MNINNKLKVSFAVLIMLFVFKAEAEQCPNLLNDYSESEKSNPELVVYNNQNLTPYPIQQVDEALNFYFSVKQPQQPLVLYVHGRALGDTNNGDYDREPKESKDDVIPVFSSKYKTRTVLMLHWRHKRTDGENGFPEDDAKFAGKALTCVIQELSSDKFNSNKYPGFRVIITHSMGSLVLEEALNTSTEVDLHDFNTVAIFAAASRAGNASSWLSKIKANKQYVLVNTKDVVLKQVKERMGFIPLGICDSDCFRNNQLQLVSNVTYLDITDIAGMPFNKRHNYFVKGKVADRVVTKIIKGELPPMGNQGISANHRIIRN